MDLNKLLSKIGSAIVITTVFMFAVFLIIDYTYGSFFVCLILPIGFIMMTAGLHSECEDDRKVAGNIGIILAAVYCTLIMLVYFAQTTTVANEKLNDQASSLIDFKKLSLIFKYDLLGYGMMALSTFFTGLSIKAKNSIDKWLKALLIIHGAFFPGCFIMPMTGIFANSQTDKSGNGGTIALVIWCIYFLPVGVLALLHFSREKKE